MNSLIKKLKPFVLGFVYVFFGAMPVWADDTEIYFSPNLNASGVRNNILFVLDTSGSMDSTDTDDVSRMDELKSAFKTVIGGLDNVNVGLMRFSNPGGPILYPVTNINQQLSLVSYSGSVNKAVQTGNDDGFELHSSHAVYLNKTRLELGQDTAIYASEGAVNVQVANNSDDVEYRGGINFDTSSPDLDVNESNNLVAGVRFANVAIPTGATVTSAYIQFVVRDSDSSGTMTTEILAEKASGSTFSNASNFNSRYTNTANLSSVGNRVVWSSPMLASDLTVQTPDLTAMVQEIVSGSWTSGNAMTFFFRRPTGSLATGRMGFTTRDDSAQYQPRLVVNYSTGAVQTGSVTTALRFTTINIPKGASITGAHIELVSAATLSDPSTQVKINAESSGDSLALTTSASNITGRAKTSAVTTWDITGPWAVDSIYRTPDLTAQVKEVVDRSDWCGGNAMTFFLAGFDGRRLSKAYESGSNVAPKLVVTYNKDTVPEGASCQKASLARQIQRPNDDAEERTGTGQTTELTSDDLDIGARLIGLRFSNITIPPDAVVESAYIQMQASENSSSVVSWTIKGELKGDAAPFETGAGHNDNIKNRSTTSAAVTWAIPNSTPWADNTKYTSPDIKTVVQEILDYNGSGGDPGWTGGNDLVLLVRGFNSNSRAVDSYDESAGSAPTLIINYRDDGRRVSGRTVKDELLEIVDNLQAEGWTPSQDTLYEAVQYFRGEPVQYGKVRGNPAQSYTRVSHPDSYTGGASNKPECQNSSNGECASEQITGSPVYKSPVTHACQVNRIVFLSDGLPNNDHSTDEIKALPSFPAGPCSHAGAGECAPELAKWVFDTADLSSTLPGRQNAAIDTVAFYLSGTGFLNDIAKGSGATKTAYTASSTESLVDALEKIVGDSMSVETSFVAAGAAVNAFNRTLNRDSLYFSVFKPEKTTSWPGNMKKYRLAFDASGVPTIVDKNGDPAVDEATGQFKNDDPKTQTVEPTSQSYWSPSRDGSAIMLGGAGALINSYSARKVYTNIDATKSLSDTANAVADGNPLLTAGMLGFSTSMLSIPSDTAMASNWRTNLINWIQGRNVSNLEAVPSTASTATRYVFADPLHSRPVAVTYGGTEADPIITLFVASNSGFLHAIEEKNISNAATNTAVETFAFIPQELLPLQKTLFENSDSEKHPYGLDGSITSWVIDPDGDGLILKPDQTVQDNNRVILVVGMGRGGKSYYALDVTKRTEPKLLWVKKAGETGFQKMGQTWSQPEKAMIKLSGDTAPRRVLIFGGGYDPQQDTITSRQSDSQGNAVYIVDLLTGELLWRAGAGTENNLNVSDMKYSIPAKANALDISGDGLTDYFFVGDMGGQVWRFDIKNGQAANSLVTGGVIADLGVASGANTSANNRRFYNTPGVFLGKNNGTPYLGLLIGSGWRGHPLDDVTVDRFYMIRQNYLFAAPPTYEKLTEANLYDTTSNLIAQGAESERSTAQGALIGASGWYITMGRKGEKILTDPIAINGEVYFSSYSPVADPNADPCQVQLGSNWAYRISATDARPTVDLDGDGVPEIGERSQKVHGTGIVGSPALISTEDGHALIQGTNASPVPLGDLLNIKRVYWYENRAR